MEESDRPGGQLVQSSVARVTSTNKHLNCIWTTVGLINSLLHPFKFTELIIDNKSLKNQQLNQEYSSTIFCV